MKNCWYLCLFKPPYDPTEDIDTKNDTAVPWWHHIHLTSITVHWHRQRHSCSVMTSYPLDPIPVRWQQCSNEGSAGRTAGAGYWLISLISPTGPSSEHWLTKTSTQLFCFLFTSVQTITLAEFYSFYSHLGESKNHLLDWYIKKWKKR